MRVVGAAVVLVAAVVAGCVSEAPGHDDGADRAALQAGLGAISGLLVDDRFRPIQATEAGGASAFQGFVLLQETGETRSTTENGEFVFVNLEPGRYTLRVQVDEHEATVQQVTVTADAFAEATIIARRITNLADRISVQEYTFFVPCSSTFFTAECVPDMDSQRARGAYHFNFSEEAAAGLRYVHWDVKASQAGVSCLELRVPANVNREKVQYGNWCTEGGGDYLWGVLEVGENFMDDGKAPYDPETRVEVVLFYSGPDDDLCFSEEYQMIDPSRENFCLGAGVGIKAKAYVSLFWAEPEGGIESYCLQC